MNNYYFISGLPRSGQKLLSKILIQNPKIFPQTNTPLENICKSIIHDFSLSSDKDIQKIEKIILGVFNNYCDVSDKNIFFDVNYRWTLHLPMLKEIFPNTKIILCVRDIDWVLDSFEQTVRKFPFFKSNIFSEEEGYNVYTRCEALLKQNGLLGDSYSAVKQAITSKEKNMLYILEYEKLCRFPEQTMKELYDFIDQDYYAHDFNNLKNHINENFGTIRQKLEFIPRQMIIPPDIREMVRGWEVWR